MILDEIPCWAIILFVKGTCIAVQTFLTMFHLHYMVQFR